MRQETDTINNNMVDEKDKLSGEITAATSQNKERDYWLEKLSGKLEKCFFPYDFNKKNVEYSMERFTFRFDPGLSRELLRLSKGLDYTLHMILTAGVVALLAQYTGSDDIITGTTIYKQKNKGKFINTILALRHRLKEGGSFKELLMMVRETLIEATDNQNYPIETLVYKLNISFNKGEFPLFDVVVLLENIHDKQYLKHICLNMIFSFSRAGESIEGEVEYNSSLYSLESIERLLSHLENCFQTVVNDIVAPVDRINIFTEEQKKQLLLGFNDTKASYPGDKTITDLFEEQVKRTPENAAIIDVDGAVVSYRELNEKANRLAGILREKGVKTETIVGIMVERSAAMVTAMMGVMKAGGAYLPIDSEYPRDRVEHMVADSCVKLVLTKKLTQDKVPAGVETFYLDSPDAYHRDHSNLDKVNRFDNMAYIIYTSGSTGKPKGVAVEHRSIVNTLWWRMNYYRFNENDAVLQLPSFSFDSSVEDIFTALLSGAHLVLVREEDRYNIDYLKTVITGNAITHFLIVPSFYKILLEEIPGSLKSLRSVTVAGDAFPEKLVRMHFEKLNTVRLYNEYGPTENSVCSTVYEFHADRTEVIIGKPVNNVSCYILDKKRNLKPIGVAGELYLSGTGVARGYLNNTTLTWEKFIENPFVNGERMYYTGDLAQWLPDGNLQFLGRVDHQVKIRGYRIELGEIENRLSALEEIKEAAVVVRTDEKEDKYICAYLVSDKKFELSELQGVLSRDLPDYMLPSTFVYLDKLPLSVNGKVDRSALPEPVIKVGGKYTAPRNKVEETLVEIWAEVLGTDAETIGIDSNFFEMGGHSLKATILASRIHKELDVKIPISEVFRTPTIRELSGYLERTLKAEFVSIPLAEERDYYVLTPAQKRLYVLQQLESESVSYNVSFIAPMRKEIEKEKLEAAFRELIARHESLRTSFVIKDGEPVFRVHKEMDFSIDDYDLRVNGESEKEIQEATKKIINGFIKPFNLSTLPLMRSALIRMVDENVLLFDMHHIIIDGVSYNILTEDIISLYDGEKLEPLKLQYKDYAVWQNNEDQKKVITRQETYWINKFSDELPVLNLPTDFPRPQLQSFEGSEAICAIEERQTQAVKNKILNLDVTLYIYFLAVLNILFSKLSGQEDIIVGTPIAARRHADLEGIIGIFINTLAMRNNPLGEKSFREFVGEVKRQTLEAYDNQEYPFEKLVERVAVKRDTSRNPIFDVMFNFLNQLEYSSSNIPGVDTENKYKYVKKDSKFDLLITAIDFDKKIYFNFEYCTRLFKPDTIDRIIGYFKKILTVVTENLDVKISDINILSANEEKDILELSSGLIIPLESKQTIHQLFEEKAREIPEKVAVVFGETFLSYGELNRRANQLARILRGKGVGVDNVVGLMMDRSPEMIIAIMAIMKAGGACLPIDPDYPMDRIKYMLKDGRVSIVLTAEHILGHILEITLENLGNGTVETVITQPRERIYNFDSLPAPDRSLVDYNKYHKYIASAMAKHTVAIQATRGCPYQCIFCDKICFGKYVPRSAENIFAEIQKCYDAGARRFTFIDDVFNLDEKNASALLNKLIKDKMDIQLFFANGLRGDILSKEFIDLMAEAGATTICLALESASPRIQKLIKKNLNIEKFRDNVHYLIRKYPQILLEMELMHGFPSETEEEAMMTLNFLKELKWIHFPDLHILKIFPSTPMYKLALENGISREQVARSLNLAYHEIPETLPFSKDFTRKYQASFLNDYFFLKERFLEVLPYQMNVLTEDELAQKYDSYLPMKIRSFSDILEYAGISREELGNATLMQNTTTDAPDFSERFAAYSHIKNRQKAPDAMRVLLLDLSLLFNSEKNDMLYDVVEAPLGLMYLMTYLSEKFGDRIESKTVKSRIDFDSYEELKNVVFDFKPDLIGIRTLSLYKKFFHHTVSLLRLWGVDVPIVSGGPYATTEYTEMLGNHNVDIAVLGEGELTFAELIGKMLENEKKIPSEEVMRDIQGLAFIKSADKPRMREKNLEALLVDEMSKQLARYGGENLEHINTANDLIYVIYTSGSTGKPKGVMLEHKNMVNLIENTTKHTNIDCRSILQFHTISFDASFHEIFAALLTGGELHLVDNKTRGNINALLNMVEKSKIKTLFLPMSLLKIIFGEKDNLEIIPQCLEHIQTAGEKVIINEIFKKYLRENGVYLHNHYGPSETHVITTLTIDPKGEIPELPTIGRPIINTFIYILDKNNHLLPVGIPGELCSGGFQVGRGYFGREDLTKEKFLENPFIKGDVMYRTGDLARWLPDGNIDFLGRFDSQVKIRGFRVEPGEIENRLLNYEKIQQAAVEPRENEKGEKYLCAYIVPNKPEAFAEGDSPASELKRYLSGVLPDYMIPTAFMLLDEIPLTQSGKINRRALPDPKIEADEGYVAPGNQVEKKLAEIWSEILGIKRHIIGIDSNFFNLGGHSLSAMLMVLKIHKNFNVKMPLWEVFKTPHIKGLSDFICQANENKFIELQPIDRKEHYPVFSAQKRLYILQHRKLDSLAFNMPIILILEKETEKEKMELIFRALIERHESLRTSFEVIGDQPVQKVHQPNDITFKLEYHEVGRQKANEIVDAFIRPFELDKAPLLRAGLVKTENSKYVLMVDMHHIVSDGMSLSILKRDFMAYYRGEELTPLRIQYKDYVEWLNNDNVRELINEQEKYWLKEFQGEMPQLSLPLDYERPPVLSFEGSAVIFTLDKEKTTALKQLAAEEGVTLFIILLAIYNVLLSKISGQEEIIVGTGVAGRNHTDLQQVIGMFVNMLALRNHPMGQNTFTRFLREVKECALSAFENQDYQYEDLVEKVVPNTNSSRNPLFDTILTLQSFEPAEDSAASVLLDTDTGLEPTGYKHRISKFDISLIIAEREEWLSCGFEYRTTLFKEKTIRKFIDYFIEIASILLENKEIVLNDISISHDFHVARSNVVEEDYNDFGF